jgi:hypothetical protein
MIAGEYNHKLNLQHENFDIVSKKENVWYVINYTAYVINKHTEKENNGD